MKFVFSYAIIDLLFFIVGIIVYACSGNLTASNVVAMGCGFFIGYLISCFLRLCYEAEKFFNTYKSK